MSPTRNSSDEIPARVVHRSETLPGNTGIHHAIPTAAADKKASLVSVCQLERQVVAELTARQAMLTFLYLAGRC